MTCITCNDSGIIQALLRENPTGIFAFRCSCKRAMLMGRPYPEWDNADKKKFIRVSEWETLQKSPIKTELAG